MAADFTKVLGQVKPAANTKTAIYTVPASTTVVLKFLANNQSGAQDGIALSLAVANAADDDKQYIYGSTAGTGAMTVIPGNATLELENLAMAASDVVYVRSANGTTTFTITGIENT